MRRPQERAARAPPGTAQTSSTTIPQQTRTQVDEHQLLAKHRRLEELLRDYGSVCIGYSGGVDSVFLARVALDTLGAERVLAVTGRSEAYPAVQHRVALECVQRFGIPHLEVGTDELADPHYTANPSNRCYFCKSELWTVLGRVARERGLAVVVDGSNADDASDHRPGALAALERGVCSPLQEAGMRKQDIRILSERLGLPTWDQPAAPCLASRIPYGLEVTPPRLRAIELAEDALRELGLVEFRVRHHGEAARVEVRPEEMACAVERAAAIAERVGAAGFERVLLDVQGYRRGALNEGLPVLNGSVPA